MRIFLFSIIACLIGLSITLHSDAIPWTSEEDRARAADSIAVGRIESYQDDGAHRYYEISIIKWIKNPQPDQTITMRSITPETFNPHFPFAVFQEKDLGLFYLRLIDGKWQSTNYSHQIWASELSDTIYNMKKLVGNNNPDSAVTLERACKEGYVNAVKNRTGEIACVKPQTLQKLRERGWVDLSPDHGAGVISFDPPIKPGTILAVGDNARNSGMSLEMIPDKEYQAREDSRKPWPPNPILEITDKDLHPKVKAMLNEMWNFEGYTQSKYNKNVLAKSINLNSTEWDHQSIYDWLKENHKKQFGGNVDAGFTNYFRYDGRIYSLSWTIAD